MHPKPNAVRIDDLAQPTFSAELAPMQAAIAAMLFETLALMPSWRDYYCSTDQTPSYEYLRTVLKVLQWLRGGTRWVVTRHGGSSDA